MIRRLKQDVEGSYTLEASLVMPTVLMCVMLLLFLCLYLFQSALLQQTAAAAAERTAFSWDNSSKDPRTGALKAGEYDRLYWRLSDDSMLEVLFGGKAAGASKEGVQLLLPAADGLEGDKETSLPLRKLMHTGALLPDSIHGNIQYGHSLGMRKISVSMDRLIHLAPLEAAIGSELHQLGRSVSYAVEPAEWIRNVELVRYYTAKFKDGRGSGKSKADAGKILSQYGKKDK